MGLRSQPWVPGAKQSLNPLAAQPSRCSGHQTAGYQGFCREAGDYARLSAGLRIQR
jgi:hypothetical protein